MVAPSGGGKTTQLYTILRDNLRGKFNNVYLICPTHKGQKIYEAITPALKKERISDEATNAKFEEFYDEIRENGERGENSLLILDDIVGTELMKMHSSLAREITRMRHHKCSVIILSQYYKNIPPVIRMNCSHYILFYHPAASEIKKYADEFGQNFMRKYNEIASEKYAYIFVDTNKNEVDPERYTDNISFS